MATIRLDAAVDGLGPVDHHLRAVLDAMPTLVWLAAPDGAAVYIGQRWLEYTGSSAEQAEGWGWTTAVHQDDINRLTAHWQTLLASGARAEIEVRLRRSDGRYRWFLFSAAPLHDDSGRLTGWCGASIDIDDRLRAEEARTRAEDPPPSSGRQFHAVVDNIPALIAIHTRSGEVELLNRAAREYRGTQADDGVHPDDQPMLIAAQQRAFASGQPLDLELRLRCAVDGAYRWCHMRSVLVSDYDGIARWYTVGSDIHDRRTAEDALRRSEAFLLEVQRLSRTGGWRYDLATDLVETSPTIQRACGVQPGDDIARPASWFERVHPDDRPAVQAQFERCLRDQTEYRAGYRVVLPDGSIRYQYATGHPVTDDAGEVVQFIGASMDMTEHWLATAELERSSQAVRDLQARISRAAQVATVGELAGSIAHEVNQPLAAVVANGHACLRWLSASPPNVAKAVEAAERIVKDGKDAGEVVRRVRALFKRTAAEKAPLDLSEVIGEVLHLLDSYPARRHIDLDVALASDLPPVFADRVQLQQLVLNLVLNALEALEPVNGRVKRLSVGSKRAETQHAVIRISDNGIGLDDPVTAFEPFVTTKPEGMGLGLSICRSIVAAHDGRLSAERNEGFGMTFTVTLPLHLDVVP